MFLCSITPDWKAISLFARSTLSVNDPLIRASVLYLETSKTCRAGAPEDLDYTALMDVIELSRLTHLCNITRILGAVPLDWQTGVVVPLSKKGGWRVFIAMGCPVPVQTEQEFALH